MTILVTGGLGYIGSHATIELLNNGENVVIIDNLSNSEIETLDKIKKITQKEVSFYQTDLLDFEGLGKVFKENNITAVMHFAGLKAVNESVHAPLKYYQNNVTGTINLCQVMKENDVKTIIFSSSATVYGVPKILPISEQAPLSTINPYGSTKLMIENILKDIYHADNDWSIFVLRYFNPIGAHESGEIGEKTDEIPNNLMPYILKVAKGELQKLHIFGGNYPTNDGTAVRDYIHVTDLVKGHVKALEKSREKKGFYTYNLGTGKGYSVLEIVHTFEKVTKQKINYVITEKREGDVPICYADPIKSKNELDWVACLNIEKMCLDAWNWAKETKKTIS